MPFVSIAMAAVIYSDRERAEIDVPRVELFCFACARSQARALELVEGLQLADRCLGTHKAFDVEAVKRFTMAPVVVKHAILDFSKHAGLEGRAPCCFVCAWSWSGLSVFPRLVLTMSLGR